jgi:uncharacterized cupin superfamily protein
MSRPNVFAGEWEYDLDEEGIRGRTPSISAGARELVVDSYELAPGAEGYPLHAHYSIEELFVVLRGRPTLRTGEGEEQLETGDVVACPRGLEGMHTLANRSDEPALVLAISTVQYPDVVIRPELGIASVSTRPPWKPLAEGEDPGVVTRFCFVQATT